MSDVKEHMAVMYGTSDTLKDIIEQIEAGSLDGDSTLKAVLAISVHRALVSNNSAISLVERLDR